MRPKDRRIENRRAHQWLRESRNRERSLRTPRHVDLRRLWPGTVVWADVPFADADRSKLRPVLVHRVEGDSVLVRKITTAFVSKRFPFFLEVEDLAGAHLGRRCAYDLRDTIRLGAADLVGISGQVSDAELLRVEVAAAVWHLMTMTPAELAAVA